MSYRKPTTTSKGPPKAGAKAKPGASEAKPIKVRKGEKVVLLSGGNPQIAKADGDAPVQAYIAAMPGWKRDLGKRLDALIVRNVPNVRKAVKWNSPFYGIEGQGWFLSFHVFTRYVKVTFFRGTSLRPVPPGAQQGQGHALRRHPRRRRARRGADGDLGEAGGRVARLDSLADRPEALSPPSAHEPAASASADSGNMKRSGPWPRRECRKAPDPARTGDPARGNRSPDAFLRRPCRMTDLPPVEAGDRYSGFSQSDMDTKSV